MVHFSPKVPLRSPLICLGHRWVFGPIIFSMEGLPVEVIELHKPLWVCVRVCVAICVYLKKDNNRQHFFDTGQDIHIPSQVINLHYYEKLLPFPSRKLDAFQLLHSAAN